MSKASQRRLADAQKRYEAMKKKDPLFRAFAAMEEADPMDMLSHPASYFKKVMAALQVDPPHPDVALLDKFQNASRPIFEALHDSVEYAAGTEAAIPGLVIQFGKNGVISVSPRSQHFFDTPGPGTFFHEHLVAQEMKKSCFQESAVAWFWIASAPVPGLPMMVLAASRSGAGRLWMHIEGQWLTSPTTNFFGIVFEDDESSFSRTRHERAKRSLDRALENGVMPRGSSWCDIPGTANAVSDLIMDFAAPYLTSALSLAMMVADVKTEAAEEAQSAKDAQQRERNELRAELASVRDKLSSERLVTSGLRGELARSAKSKGPHQEHAGRAPVRPLSDRMGVFFGQ